MLRYDAAWLIEYYRNETPARPGLPYSQIGGAGPSRIIRQEQTFELQDVLEITPRMDYDESIVRLVDFDGSVLTVEPARYSDGMKSNYAMDAPGNLRERLRADYGASLPPWSDPRLSNGVGTAVVVYDGSGRPYLPRRAPRQNVFPGGYHCTASGEAAWSEAEDFDGLITAQVYRELAEEAGLARVDIDWVRPVAFCREFLRGGKPQFFFAAGTSLDEDALAARRRAAIEKQIARGRQEILDEILAEVTPETLHLCTIECVANLQLAAGATAPPA
jgi:hypothetical protein